MKLSELSYQPPKKKTRKGFDFLKELLSWKLFLGKWYTGLTSKSIKTIYAYANVLLI